MLRWSLVNTVTERPGSEKVDETRFITVQKLFLMLLFIN